MNLTTQKKIKFPSITLIHSSAGSGKTYQLVERYVNFLLSDIKNTDFSNIVAITFTENASKEMRERIISRLKKEALNNKKASYIVDEILDRYYYFNVKTIDSFVLSIFKAKSLDLSFKSNFDVIFNYEEIGNEVFTRFLQDVEEDKSLYSEFEKSIEILNLTSREFFLNPLPKIEKIFMKFLLNEDKYLCDIKNFSEKLVNQKKKLENKIIKIISQVIAETSGKGIYVDINRGFNTGKIYDIAKKIVEKDGIFTAGKVPEKFQNINNEIKKISYEWFVYDILLFFHPYVKLYQKFRDFFDDYLKKSQKVVLSRTVRDIYKDLIKNKGVLDVYIKLSSFMKHFLIDEFQDTSLGQWAVIRPFVEEAISSNGTGFFIGDVKQAIYMFRNADYKIMFEFLNKPSNNYYIKTEPVEKIDIYNIEENFRTDKKILEYVDSIFSSEVLGNYLNSYLPNNLSSLYNIKHKPVSKDDGYYKTIIIPKSDEFENDIKKNLINVVEDVIKRYPYSSIAILTYKNEQVEKISSWISSITPVASYSSLDVRKNPAVSSVIAFLRFLDSGDYFSFFEFINSCVFKKKYGDFYKEILDICLDIRSQPERRFIFEDEIKKRYPDFYKVIEDFRKDAGLLNVYELVMKIYRFFNIYENFNNFSSFSLKFADIVYEFSIDNYSLHNLIEMIDERDEENFSIEISPSLDAIKVMTFHKAKGLGFDVVINVFWEEKTRPNDGMYFVGTKNEVYVLKINKSHAISLEKLDKKDYKDILNGYKNVILDDAVSKINLFYVAMTRAKKELYNIVYIESKDSILKIFENEKIKNEGGKKYKGFQKASKDILRNIDLTLNKITYPFIKELDKDNELKIRGRIIHNVFSMIKNKSDFKYICNFLKKSVLAEGVSDNYIYNEILKDILSVIKDKNFIRFFEGDIVEVLNEAEIILEDGKVLRPDRVVIRNENIDIVDFKTGAYDDKHKKQIEIYCKSFMNIYPNKKIYGYLYYIDEKRLMEFYEKD